MSQGYVLLSQPLIVYVLSAKLKKLTIATLTGLPIYSFDFLQNGGSLSSLDPSVALTSSALSGVSN